MNSFEQYLNIQDQESKTHNLNEIPKNNKLLLSPDYIEINYNTLEGIFIKSPNLNNVIYPSNIDLPNIIQYYEYKRKV